MKTFLIAFALIAAVSAAEFEVKALEQVAKAQAGCIEKNAIPADIVKQLKAFDYPETPSVASYLECVARELGVWDDSKGYVTENVIQKYNLKYDLTEARAIFEKCRDDNKTGDDAKAWIVPFQRCIAASKIGDKIKERFAPKA